MWVLTQKVLKVDTHLFVRTLPLAMDTRSHFFSPALPPSIGDVRYPSGRMPGAQKRKPAGKSFSQATIWSLELVSSMHGSLVILNCNVVDLLVLTIPNMVCHTFVHIVWSKWTKFAQKANLVRSRQILLRPHKSPQGTHFWSGHRAPRRMKLQDNLALLSG